MEKGNRMAGLERQHRTLTTYERQMLPRQTNMTEIFLSSALGAIVQKEATSKALSRC